MEVLNMKKIFIMSVFFVILIFATTVNAEVKTFLGVSEHYMENSAETLEQAKDKAKISAELSAMEQAQLNVQSYSESHNSKLTRDEIITITAGILKITDVKYFLKNDSGIYLIRAEVTAEIDTDKISEFIEREMQRRKSRK